MQLLPLIYFSGLFLWIYKKRGIDVSSFVTLLYVITSFFSYLMFLFGYMDSQHENISFFTGILYCAGITVCIIPLYKLDSKNISISLNKSIIIKFIYFYFAVFFVFWLFEYKSIIFVMTFGDYATLRQMALDGNIYGMGGGGGFKLLRTFITIFASGSFIMIPVVIITIMVKDFKWYHTLMALVGSSTSIFQGILNINRSSAFYYIIFLALSLTLFWPKLSIKMKARITPIIALSIIGIGVYFMAVSSDRFENSDEGTNGGLIEYAGQPYSNFCYFFDNYHNPNGISTCFFFPFTNYLISGYRGGTQRELEQEKVQSLDCVSFKTFMGSIVMDCNQYALFFYIALYVLLCQYIRKKMYSKLIPFSVFIFAFVLISIPSIGCITYYYTLPFTNLMIFLMIFYYNRSNKNKIYENITI